MNITTIYDIGLLVLFAILVSIFLYRKRKNLKREGLLFLYKTKVGVKIINYIGNKYKKTLNVLSYISIGMGYILMAGVVYLFYTIVRLYIFRPDITSQIKVPPIMPLLPYLPQVFKLDLPPFYFIYWIVIIAIVAISHEFSHGIFAINKDVRIKSTGFGFFPFFLPVFLAAFVELDEKKMKKKKIIPQMAILSAGTFANVVVGILFFLIFIIFFMFAFSPAGIVYDTYTYSIINVSEINYVNGIPVYGLPSELIIEMINNANTSEIEVNGLSYIATREILDSQSNIEQHIILYDNAPAIRANLSDTIIKIDGVIINSKEKLRTELLTHYPGEEIIITVLEEDAYKDYFVTLGENPLDKTIPYLGVGFMERKSSGIMGRIINLLVFKDPNVYYTSNFGIAEYIYYLLWWLVIISISVAFMNMLPVGIFDGGRFFYLTILGITKNENKAKKAFSLITWLFLFLLLVIMVFWGISFFR